MTGRVPNGPTSVGVTADGERVPLLVTGDGAQVVARPDHGDLVPHRLALTAPDSPNSPAAWSDDAWVQNLDLYTAAKVSVKGIAWSADDTALSFEFQLWRKGSDGPERCGTFTVVPTAKEDAILTDVGSVTYQLASVVDSGQDFDLGNIKPVGSDDPSLYAILAEPALTSDPAFMAWAGAGGIPQALNVRTSHFGGSGAGWDGGLTPDGTVVQYEVFLPNIDWADVFDELGGDWLAVTLASVTGTGQYLLDVGVVLS